MQKEHNEVLTRAFLSQRKAKANSGAFYDIKDAYHDVIEGDLMYYIDTVEVKTPEEIKKEEEFQKQVDSEIKNTDL